MIWSTVSCWSCFCWLYRASPSLAAKNIISLISVLTIWWCPCVECSLVLLEEGVCYDQCIFLAKLLAFALLHSTFQGQICLLLQVFLDFLLLHSSPLQFYITWGEIITVYSFYKLFTNIVKDHIFRKPMLYYRQLVFKLFCLGFTK